MKDVKGRYNRPYGHWNSSLPRIVLGDFNTPTDSVHLSFLRDAGMSEAFESAGNGSHVTWPVGFPVHALDQVWLQGMIAKRCELHDTAYSDHRLVAVELESVGPVPPANGR